MIDVVGLPAEGWAGLAPRAQGLIAGATVLIGGERHLDLVAEQAPAARRLGWPRPLREGLPELLSSLPSTETVVVLASGDPFVSGVGTTLVEVLGADEVRVHPAVSSVALARAAMGWSAESCEVVTTVGRDLRAVLPGLAPGARLVVLLSDGDGPAALAALLTGRGWGASRVSAWWHLGSEDEGGRAALAAQWPSGRCPDLVLACVEVAAAGRSEAEDVARAIGPAPGRPEDAFDTDGQITKRDVRASALAHLRPADGSHLWDLGAGSGAVGLEWCLTAPRATCTAVERQPERAARIRRNADELGVGARLTVLESDVLPALPSLTAPDAVFIGGGLSAEVLDSAWAALPAGGRLVAHAVTLESESVLAGAAGRLGGHLTRISVEHAEPLGRYLSWTPLRPVVQLSALKPDQERS